MKTLWKGAVSFGLVYIPIKLYSAVKSREISFKLLHKKDLSEIRYARICKTEEKEIPWEEIVKGYEKEDGSMAFLEEEDLKNIQLETSHTIEIVQCSKIDEIDPIYYENIYYVEPEAKAEKAYQLLMEALKKSQKVAIGRFIFHNHEQLGILRAQDNILILHTLRYQTEIRSHKELKLPSKKQVVPKELSLALDLIDKLTHPFHPKDYFDSYVEQVKHLMKKRKSKKPAKKDKKNTKHGISFKIKC